MQGYSIGGDTFTSTLGELVEFVCACVSPKFMSKIVRRCRLWWLRNTIHRRLWGLRNTTLSSVNVEEYNTVVSFG